MANKDDHRVYMREYIQKLRIKAFKKLGTFCWACYSTDKLHLHHDYYTKDSAMSSKSGGHSEKRYREAIIHPERFMVLCSSCHHRFHQLEQADKYLEDPIKRIFGLIFAGIALVSMGCKGLQI